jgi:hypothetical protein
MPQRARRPRGHIRELPSGSFQAIACAGTDPLTGKLRYVRERGPYEVIAADLRQQIQDGRLAPGSFVPTTTELARAWSAIASHTNSGL